MKNSKIFLALAGVILTLFSACRRSSIIKDPQTPLLWQNAGTTRNAKKRILILSSSGGGGHTAAANSIKEYLKEGYEVAIVNVFEEILHPLDPIRKMTQNQYNSEDLYNFFIINNLRWCADNMRAVGKLTLDWLSHDVQSILTDFFKLNKPDALISVMPIFNGDILAVAEKLEIPFSVVSLDQDLMSIGFLRGIDHPTYKKFIFGIPYDEEAIKEVVIKKSGIAPEQIRPIGVPVKPSFLQRKHSDLLRKEFRIPQDASVVMVLMGSLGSGATFRYAKALSKVKAPLHILLCLGRNEQLRKTIEERIVFPPHITVSIIGFTDRIADYMAVSDMLITKPGSVSLFEALTAQVPIFFDETRNGLVWERMNITFVKEHDFGQEITMMRKVPKLVDTYLEHPEKLEEIRARMAEYMLPQVRHQIVTLVEEMVAMNQDGKSSQKLSLLHSCKQHFNALLKTS